MPRFASEHYRVLVAGRTASKIDAVARAIIAASGHAEAVVTDTTNEDDVLHLFGVGVRGDESLGQIGTR